ncbi:MAG: hypothetical protein J6K41_01010 [Paraprevotella sp.]|nr:hypothetical protein [Paraprevotella sp.]
MNGIKYAMLAGIATLLCTGITSCDNDDEDVVPAEEVTTPKTVSVTFGASASLGLGQIAEGIYSEKPFIAEVDAQGIVTGKHVGSTVVHNGSQTVNVTVTGTVNLFPEPVTAWGATMDEVKKQHALGGWLREGNSSSGPILWCVGCSDAVRYITYMLSGPSTTLSACDLYTPTSSVDFQALFKQYSERYNYLGASRDEDTGLIIYLFCNDYSVDESTTGIILTENILIKKPNSNLGLIAGHYHYAMYIYMSFDEETTPAQTPTTMLKHATQRARTLNILPE